MAIIKEAAIRKRQQIDSSKRSMFTAVAVVALVSGMALVVSFFLVQQIMFHAKVIARKQDTVNAIKFNLKQIESLKNDIRALDANEALNSVKSSDDSTAVQVILDALPADLNADALGASLQNKLAGGVDGLRVDSMSVVDPSGGTSVSGTASQEDGTVGIDFQMSVTGPAESLRELLIRMERSIRVIEIKMINIQSSNSGLTMTLSGKAFYKPARVIELRTETELP